MFGFISGCLSTFIAVVIWSLRIEKQNKKNIEEQQKAEEELFRQMQTQVKETSQFNDPGYDRIVTKDLSTARRGILKKDIIKGRTLYKKGSPIFVDEFDEKKEAWKVFSLTFGPQGQMMQEFELSPNEIEIEAE